MSVTFTKLAEHLVKHGVYECQNNRKVFCYITCQGEVLFFAKWDGYTTREYTSVQALITKTKGLYAPTANELAEREARAVAEAVTPTTKRGA